MHHPLCGLSGREHTGPLSAGGCGQREALRRAHRGAGGDLPAHRPFGPRRQDEVENIFAQTLTEQGFNACAPYNGEQWAIGAEGAVCLKEGTRIRIEHHISEGAARAATVFQRLLNAGKRLLRVIEHNEGGANKDLAKFADQINALCDKWDR